MALMDMMRAVLEESGLLPLWNTLAPWLALDERQLIFVVATPVFIAVTLWEYLRIRHDPTRMDVPEALRNFALGAGYQLTELLFAGLIAFPVYAFLYHHRLLDLELNWATGLLTFVGVDFCFYWMHRSSHRIRWFWAAHVVHHSSERMNFSTAMRQNATNIFNGMWLFYVPLALIGFNPVWIGVAYALSLVYQFFIHTTLVGKLPGWVETVLNTPSHHRVHHGRNPGYIDRNYGGTLIVWDRLFGTFVAEDEQAPPDYGITRPIHSRNLLVLWTHEYVDLFRAMARPGGLQARLKHLWKPPEWDRDAD
ncbi:MULTISPECIES: sterol desaturase family protein [Marinobacter]|jgi:sterol desaturase/sphingolipid hydroxylase (fatty acid hydroxylase superfamily)|uniref:Fatty acid hydroxylase superfamily protein n=1 Tax=Marinobacter salarius TaxID=1420917 RepID=A0A1W6K5M9_9GAMM|nr:MULTISPECIES: sterol desaturase family protein [Marinobacter]ARM82733.1 fatty acid hydroxylase superfamily protein [Marinobacter salarius]AZR41614.1 alkylglycerol monooxygenase [Marinobacter salarius]MCZ4283841.1 sterol desaturase family protein [Marinobacter salarius]MDC8456715.1 sterol desaturase family protein [Marinobacter sp. DS40M6]OLF85498.1 sterol desaturase [Marinobacter sp. C18]|tara:strand:- start:2016 stop:2939 length:924 start_codon:yes stop_codon:yes gene_type:complete